MTTTATTKTQVGFLGPRPGFEIARGPVFELGEGHRIGVYEAWSRLPVVGRLGDLPIRWLGPLIDTRWAEVVSDMTSAAYGYLGEQWNSYTPDGDVPFMDDTGGIAPPWARALEQAAEYLAREGQHAGPESSRSNWLAWLCFEWSVPHNAVRAVANEFGVD